MGVEPTEICEHRDEKLDALILNTTEKGKLCIIFDPFKNHDPLTMKGCFIEHDRLKGNQNMFLMYAEGPDMSENDPKEDKMRVNFIQNATAQESDTHRNGKMKTVYNNFGSMGHRSLGVS